LGRGKGEGKERATGKKKKGGEEKGTKEGRRQGKERGKRKWGKGGILCFFVGKKTLQPAIF